MLIAGWYYALKQLAHDLAKIWQAHSERPFTNTKKGRQRPRDFVLAICQVVEPGILDAEIEGAIRFAVGNLPGKRRGRKSGS